MGDIKKEAEKIIKNVDKQDVKKVVDKALDSKAADDVIKKVNDKTKKVDISKDDVKKVVNTVLK
ncbi:MAG: hypothetical protein J5625_00590 [Lachnospiraceae bacterium]|nr:hypothetical protein [Lachnospiraceae bacterium]